MGNTPERMIPVGIADDVEFGEKTTVVMPSNLYGCKIGNGCFIGPYVEVQRGANIGHRTRVQSHSFICDKVSIGSDCFVGHGVMFINDTFSELGRAAYTEKEVWKPTRVGDRVLIGSNATILPVEICSDVIIGAGAVVTKNIEKPGVYVGNPARYLKTHPTYRGER